MAYYAFATPVLPGKTEEWKNYIKEMLGPRNKEFKESREKVGLNIERVWLQHMPTGDFAVVYWEADDINKVFEGLMQSEAPFDKWFREKVFVGIHGMDVSKPPPMNELLLDSKA